MENKRKKIVPLKELNLTNRFLYDEVMEDREAHREALSIIFGRDIPLLNRTESEKELRVSPLLRSVRMDIISVDEEETVYDSEMQSERKVDLVKRSRYYQAHLDTSLLEPGVPSYNLLNDTYIIFITPFDPFGYGKYRYTFRPVCEEVSDCRLEDGATRIFLNTRGRNDGDVSEELVEFLHYLEDTSDEKAAASNSERIRRIHERVRKVKGNEEIGMKYLAMLEEKYYAKQEGLEEGEQLHLILQVRKKLHKGKSLEESADDLEMEPGELEPVYNLVRDHAEKTDEEILELL